MLKRAALATMLLGIPVLPYAETQPACLLTGTWKLKVATSNDVPGSLVPTSSTVRLVVSGNTLTSVQNGVDSHGRRTHAEYTAKLDGQDYPWRGTLDGTPNPTQDALAVRRIDDYTYEWIYKLNGQVLSTQRTVIAKDGKSRVTTTTANSGEGGVVSSAAVWERVSP